MKNLILALILFAGFQCGYAADGAAVYRTVLSGISVLTQDSTRALDVGKFKFFSGQINVTGTTVDIDSIAWECSNDKIDNFSEYNRCPDKDGSITYGLVFNNITAAGTFFKSIAPPPTRNQRFIVFAGATASGDMSITFTFVAIP